MIIAMLNVLMFTVLLLKCVRNPDQQKSFFAGYYFLTLLSFVLPLTAGILFRFFPQLYLSQIWKISYLLQQSGYLLFLFFIHVLKSEGKSKFWTAGMSLLTLSGMITYLSIYSIFPQLIEMLVLIYILLRLMVIRRYFNEGTDIKGLSELASILLFCTALFSFGMILDILEAIPFTRPDFTLFYIDFHPLYLLTTGGGFLYWSVREKRYSHCEESEIFGKTDSLLKTLGLSKREREIAGLILKGMTNKQIANHLFISESTVKKHINNFFKKLSISSRWELVGMCHPIRHTPEHAKAEK